MTDLQQTVSENAAAVAEVQGQQKQEPVVIADPTDPATTQAAVISILGILRAQGVTTPT